MKAFLFLLTALFCLTTSCAAIELPEELMDVLPEQAETVLPPVDWSQPDALHQGLAHIGEMAGNHIHSFLRQRLHNAVQLLMVVLLCGAVNGTAFCTESKSSVFLPMAGAVSITALTAGSVESLLGLGRTTIHQLSQFSQVLLPALATASAAAGGLTSATLHQMITLFAIQLLVRLMDSLLVPLILLDIALLTAGACLPDHRLDSLAEGLKKGITWTLCTALLFFTGYLSITGHVGGAVDATAIKLTRAAVSGVVPVVGKIIADTTETVLAGAGLLRNTIGVFGLLAVLSACCYPFLQLAVQYILYKLVSFLASVIGQPGLCRLISGLGGAFGLTLGMTGACALLLLISILSFLSVVIP